MAAAAVPTEDGTRDFSLPTLDVRLVARRAALPAAALAAVAAFLLIAGGPLEAFADALRRALDADPVWVVAAAAFELLSFGGYVALLWLVGGRASSRLGARESTQITLGGAAATRLLPTAGVGGAALTLWALKRSGLSTRGASRTLLAFLILLYSVFLASIAVTGTLLAEQGEGPLVLTALPAAGATAGIVIALLAGAVHPTRTGRVWTAATVLGESVRDAIRHLLSGDVRLLGALAWWGFDMAVLWAMLHAFGAPPAFAIVVLAYFVGQVGNTVPIPGAVSGGLVGVLLAFGVEPDLAIVSVLAYRAIAIWVPVPVGLASLRGLRRTMNRWGRADEAPTPTVVTPADRPLPLTVVPPADRPLPRERRIREPWPCLDTAAA
jgi:uncharacterized membrane protein YbhN (UPF0104 family)